MIMPEKEAARKACPFATSFNASHGSRYVRNASSERGDLAMCIGSACMAWDFIDPEYIAPNAYIEHPDGHWGPTGVALSQDTSRDSETLVVKETKEQFVERLTKVRLGEGFERVEKFAADSVSGWRKLHPKRRGQCLRTIIIEPNQP